MSYTPKNNFNLRIIKTGDTVPIYTSENNSNLQLKRAGVGEIGFRKKLLANVTCCNTLDYRFNFDFNPDYVSVSGGIVINIIEGCADFTWEITGSDFTLDDATTSVRYNIVRAGAGTTVGTTEILTVTDSCNTIIEATIVCCDANVCCDQPDYAFTYSGDDPIETGLDIPYKLTLEGGCPPFLWQINQETLTLTVTDDCGTVIEIGYIGIGSPYIPALTNVSTNYITIGGPCGGISIGYTTQGMHISEVQDLTVEGAQTGDNYYWDITSGGGELSSPTGVSITYTAPDSNTYCVENATITLTTGGIVCDILQIAVNAYTGDAIAYELADICWNCVPEGYTDYGITCNSTKCWKCLKPRYRCDGVFLYASVSTACWSTECTGCLNSEDLNYWCNHFCGDPGITDYRSEAMKIAGCCPGELF